MCKYKSLPTKHIYFTSIFKIKEAQLITIIIIITGVMWSYFLVPVTTQWVLDSLEFLQQAVTDTVQQAVAVIQAATDECMHQRFIRIYSQWRPDHSNLSHQEKQDRQSDATWSAMLSWPSITTPRSDTVVENWTLADSRDSSVVESLSSCCRVPSHTSCVLSAFILSRLLDIHASTRSTHSTNIWVVVEVDAAGALMYTYVSSAYEYPVSVQ